MHAENFVAPGGQRKTGGGAKKDERKKKKAFPSLSAPLYLPQKQNS